eukprot:366278-Chlamydomonas_euryale.AAC.5
MYNKHIDESLPPPSLPAQQGASSSSCHHHNAGRHARSIGVYMLQRTPIFPAIASWSQILQCKALLIARCPPLVTPIRGPESQPHQRGWALPISASICHQPDLAPPRRGRACDTTPPFPLNTKLPHGRPVRRRRVLHGEACGWLRRVALRRCTRKRTSISEPQALQPWCMCKQAGARGHTHDTNTRPCCCVPAAGSPGAAVGSPGVAGAGSPDAAGGGSPDAAGAGSHVAGSPAAAAAGSPHSLAVGHRPSGCAAAAAPAFGCCRDSCRARRAQSCAAAPHDVADDLQDVGRHTNLVAAGDARNDVEDARQVLEHDHRDDDAVVALGGVDS